MHRLIYYAYIHVSVCWSTYIVACSLNIPISVTPVHALTVPRVGHEVVVEGEGAHVLVAVILRAEPCYSHSRIERLKNTGQGLLCELVAFEFGVQLVAIWFESH